MNHNQAKTLASLIYTQWNATNEVACRAAMCAVDAFIDELKLDYADEVKLVDAAEGLVREWGMDPYWTPHQCGTNEF